MAAAKLLLCNCQKSMQIDADALSKALALGERPVIHTELCRSQLDAFRSALSSGSSAVRVACTQEAALFAEVSEEAGADIALGFTNIRERAGWCATPDGATPKMAALLADAAYTVKPTGLTTLRSEGVCLVYGAGQTALDVAVKLSGRLGVTLLLSDADDVLLPTRLDFPVHKGRIRTATGHLGAFHVVVDGEANLIPSSRGTPQFTLPRQGAASECDLIVDLSGGMPLFPPHARRDGYLRADPGSPAAVAEAMLAATDLVGEFEKPLYVAYDADICAHSRSGKVGCRNCLDACPTGAIAPDGDAVVIDAAICGGCGSCSAVCPTGAVNYAYPGRDDLVTRVQIMLAAYRGAGGERPSLLLHDGETGEALIGAMARLGRGLPANVIPITQHAVTQTGHDLLLAMVAAGAEHVVVHVAPNAAHERPALDAQVALAARFIDSIGIGSDRIHVVETPDPDVLEEALHGLTERQTFKRGAFATQTGKRDLARVAIARLREDARAAGYDTPDLIPLDPGAPYGRIIVAEAGCTLCLSCVGACPTGAITDNPERPQISFTEAACVQCGLCVATCPERVIGLEPRYDFTPAALTANVIKFEEPFDCVRCGKPFGTRSSIEAVVKRLEGHSMFRSGEQLRLVQMCDDCRVITVAEGADNPFRMADRPRVRTTDDYLAEAAQMKKSDRTPDDFLN